MLRNYETRQHNEVQIFMHIIDIETVSMINNTVVFRACPYISILIDLFFLEKEEMIPLSSLS